MWFNAVLHSTGIDLGETTFYLVALGAAGNVLVNFWAKRLEERLGGALLIRRYGGTHLMPACELLQQARSES